MPGPLLPLPARPGPRGGPQASASPPAAARRFPAAVPGEGTSMLQKREKVLLLRTFQGRTLRIVREHYLRPSVPCNSPLCPQPAACLNGQGREGPGRPGPEERGRPGPEERRRPGPDVARAAGHERREPDPRREASWGRRKEEAEAQGAKRARAWRHDGDRALVKGAGTYGERRAGV